MSRYTEKETITRAEYLQLEGLKMLAEKHNRALQDIVETAAAITGETDIPGGFTDEMVYGDFEVADTLGRLGIEVEE